MQTKCKCGKDALPTTTGSSCQVCLEEIIKVYEENVAKSYEELIKIFLDFDKKRVKEN